MSDGNREKDETLSPSCKKIKIDNENGNSVNESSLEIKDFVLEKILSNNTNRKTVCVLGKFKNKSGVALVILEKNAFKEDELDGKGYFSVETELRKFFQNDIYGNYECFPRPSVNGTSFISPPFLSFSFLTFDIQLQQGRCCFGWVNIWFYFNLSWVSYF